MLYRYTRHILFFFLCFLLANNVCLANKTDVLKKMICGVWYTNKYTSKVKISYNEKSKTFEGNLVSVSPKKLYVEKKTKNTYQQWIGKNILYGFVFKDKKKSWDYGKIYDPMKQKLYKASIKLLGKNKLQILGYINIKWFGRSTIWHRANPIK